MRGAEGVRQQFQVEGLHCPSCAGRIERELRALQGVCAARVHFAAGRVAVNYDPEAIAPPEVAAVLERMGHTVQWREEAPSLSAPSPLTRWLPTGVAALGTVAGALLRWGGAPDAAWQAVLTGSLLVGGWPIGRAAARALRTRHTTDIHFLLVVAVIGAVSLGEWLEAASVLVLFSIAEALEGQSIERARQAIRSLVQLAPPTARIRCGDGEREAPVETVAVGDVLRIRPGDRIPLDARVLSGASTVNQAAITGEASPVEKGPGDGLFAGTFNERGFLEAAVTRPAADSTLARIVRLVEEAQARRSPTEQFVDRFARVYTPAILLLAAGISLLPPLLLGQPWGEWIYRGLTLLIIACPCALVISTPVAVVCALSRAARDGVLIRGGAALERLGALRAIAFDKTGTLTEGRPRVTDVRPHGDLSAEELLALAAAVEQYSEHPVGRAIAERARAQGRALPHAERFEALPGRGARAEVGGRSLLVGRPALVAAAISGSGAERSGDPLGGAARVTDALQAEGKSVVWVAREDALLGMIAVADAPRPASRAAVQALRSLGIARIELLTGDNAAAAGTIARAVGADDFRADLLPEEKVARVRALERETGAVGMVGDGINDAPALAAASVGIAMGAAGTEVALETASVALMGDDLLRLPGAVALSRRALRVIQANIAFSLLLKAAFLGITLAGLSSLWLAIVADTGCSLLVVANSLRLLRGQQWLPLECRRSVPANRDACTHRD